MDASDLLAALIQRQRDYGESDLQFARRLSARGPISRQTWQALRSGKVEPTHRVLRGAAAAFPDLMPQIIAYLIAHDDRPMAVAVWTTDRAS